MHVNSSNVSNRLRHKIYICRRAYLSVSLCWNDSFNFFANYWSNGINFVHIITVFKIVLLVNKRNKEKYFSVILGLIRLTKGYKTPRSKSTQQNCLRLKGVGRFHWSINRFD